MLVFSLSKWAWIGLQWRTPVPGVMNDLVPVAATGNHNCRSRWCSQPFPRSEKPKHSPRTKYSRQRTPDLRCLWGAWDLATSAGRYWSCPVHPLSPSVIDMLHMLVVNIPRSTVVYLWSIYLDGPTLKYILCLIAGIAACWGEMHCGIPSSPKSTQYIDAY